MAVGASRTMGLDFQVYETMTGYLPVGTTDLRAGASEGQCVNARGGFGRTSRISDLGWLLDDQRHGRSQCGPTRA